MQHVVFLKCTFFLFFFELTLCAVLQPTIINSTGDFYIVSLHTSQSFQHRSISCNTTTNCHIVCDIANGCNNILIESNNSTNLFMYCLKDYSCTNIKLISSSSNSTTITCIGDKSCSYSTFIINKTDLLSITCSSKINEFACFQNMYYLPIAIAINNTITNFNCFGFGCYHLGDIYLTYNQLLNTKFTINHCNQCINPNISNCIVNNTFRIHCNDYIDVYSNGNCSSDLCGCGDIEFIRNNNVSSICQYPSNYTDSISDSDNNRAPIWLIIIISIFILSIISIFLILCCFARKDLTISKYSHKKRQRELRKELREKKEKKRLQKLNQKIIKKLSFERQNSSSITEQPLKSRINYGSHSSDDESSSSLLHPTHIHHSNSYATNDEQLQIETDLETNNEINPIKDGSGIKNELLKSDDKKSRSNKQKLVLKKKMFPPFYDKGYHKKHLRKHLPIYSLDEIKKHVTSESCWIILDNLILDVTKFIRFHPGGGESVLKQAGRNCDFHFSWHSKEGKALFWRFVIGRLPQNKKEYCEIQ